MKMKLKQVIIPVVAIALVVVSGFTLLNLGHDKKSAVNESKSITFDGNVETIVGKEEVAPVPVATTEPTSIAIQTKVIQTEPAQPIILSTQEYAEMYLNLNDEYGYAQICLDTLISAFPNRFTPEVRERNIKALSIYASPCGTGYGGTQTIKINWDYLYPNGSFFDSDQAKSRW